MIMSLDTQPGSSRPASSDQTVRCDVGSATCKGVNANSRNTIIGEGNNKFLLAFSHHKDRCTFKPCLKDSMVEILCFNTLPHVIVLVVTIKKEKALGACRC